MNIINTITLGIKNYELSLNLAKASDLNTIKIFTKKNNKKITHVFLRFKVSDNDKKRRVKQLLEDTTTKLKFVRLFLGENERQKILDFLRNEENRHFTFNFNTENLGVFGFADHDDDGAFKTLNSFKVSQFKLHSKALNIKRNNPVNPISDHVIGK